MSFKMDTKQFHKMVSLTEHMAGEGVCPLSQVIHLQTYGIPRPIAIEIFNLGNLAWSSPKGRATVRIETKKKRGGSE